MVPTFLYVARSISNAAARKHHVYKVGQSTQPLKRIQSLGGSVSTECYEPILVVELPMHVRDTHVLSHPMISPFVVKQHRRLVARYVSIFGSSHESGIRRRREIVMFGSRFSMKRVKALFTMSIDGMTSESGQYVCTDSGCIANSGTTYCPVCVKFIDSIMNCIAYQKTKNRGSTKRVRILESVESQFMQMIGR